MAKIDLSQKKKIAFICSGGAVKAAAFHVGVAMALQRKGFLFQGGVLGSQNFDVNWVPGRSIGVYAGSSAGCLVSTFLAQGGQLDDLIASFRSDASIEGVPGLKYREMLYPRIRSKLDFLSFNNFLVNMFRKSSVQSPFSTEGIRKYLHSNVIKTEKFSDLQVDLFIVACELNQNHKVVFGKYKNARQYPYLSYRDDVAVSDACAASMSLPPLYHPYPLEIEGKRTDFFDGEIREPLSSHIGLDSGCDLIICSYTHQPLRFLRKNQSLADKGLQTIVLQAIYQVIEQKIRVARGYRRQERALLDTVHRFFKEHNLDERLSEKLMEELEARMTYKSQVDYIYIHPRPGDYEAFKMPHFSLNRRNTEKIVRRGFVAGMSTMRGIDTTQV